MDKKQSENSNEEFWSDSNESDEDFETLFGVHKPKEETLEEQEETKEIGEMFFKPQFEEEVDTFSEMPMFNTESDRATTTNTDGFRSIESETVSTPLEEMQQEAELDQSLGSLKILTSQTSFEIQAKNKTQLQEENKNNILSDTPTEDLYGTGRDISKGSTVLSTENMDFLWDDEDDEDVFTQSPQKPSPFDFENSNIKKVFSSTQTLDIQGETQSTCLTNEETVTPSEDWQGKSKPNIKEETCDFFVKPSDVSPSLYEETVATPSEDTEAIYDNPSLEYLSEAFPIEVKTEQPREKPVPSIPLVSPTKMKTESCEIRSLQKKFDFLSQTPAVHSLNRFVIGYSMLKQQRKNQKGENVEKQINVINIYEYPLIPIINNITSIDNIVQLDDEYKKIIEILSLKDFHVDNICDLISVKNAVYSQTSYSEKNDCTDVNNLIDLALTDKEMAIEFACKKNLWSFALLVSNNRPDVVKMFLEKTCDPQMVSLALNVFCKENTEEISLSASWDVYLKHVLRLPYGNIHLKLIEKIYNEDRNNLYVFLVALHLLKIANIGDFIEYFSRNFYFLQVVMFLNEHHTPVKNIDVLLYQYITVLCDFNKKYAEDFYKTNRKLFSSEMQTSLDHVFNVSGWGFGFKEVINFGISKILNVEEDKPTVVSEEKRIPSPLLLSRNLTKSVNLGLKKQAAVRQPPNKTYGAFDVEKTQGKINLDGDALRKGVDVKGKSEDSPMNYGAVQENTPLEEKSNTVTPKTENIPIQPSKSVMINEERSLYSDQQHAKSFADIMDLEKSQKEITTEDDTSLFLSKYNFDDNEVGLKKPKGEKKEEEQSKSFFSMFNIFKKPVYKVDLQASDDIKYDPVTKKWVSGSTQSAPQEVKKTVVKSIPLPTKGKPASKSTVDLRNMSLYANKKPSSSSVIPGMKKPSDKDNKM